MIDEEETFERFGYTSDELKPKSMRKIIAVCDGCGKIRVLNKQAYKKLCASCAQTGLKKTRLPKPAPEFLPEPERFIENTFIDRIRTIEEFGYDPLELSERSSKSVATMCKECGKYRVVSKRTYRELCASCGKLKSNKLPEPKFIPESERFLENTFIDRIRTVEKFGYDPIDLTRASNKQVVAMCSGCGVYRVVYKHGYSELCRKCRIFTQETKRRMQIANSRPRGPMPEEQKENISKALKGRKVSDEVKQKISKTATGKKFSDEHKQRMSASKQGIEYDDWTEFINNDWRTRRDVRFLNEPFDGCNRHHMTETLAICIPAELHNHIWHNLRTGNNMGEINMLAVQYVIGEW